METNNSKEETPQGEVSALTEKTSTFSSEDQNEINPFQEIFAHSSSEPNDADTNDTDQRNTRGHSKKRNRKTKRHDFMKSRMMVEKKRRQIIKERVNILHALTPYSTKATLGTKLENIVDYIKSLKHQISIMSKAYTETAGYIPFNPQFRQGHDKAPPDKTQ